MTDKTAPRTWLWVSAGLNVLLIGVIIGALTYRATSPAPPAPDTSLARIAPPGLLPALPPAERDAFRREVRRLTRESRAEMRAARSEIIARMQAETFDRAAAEAAFARVRATRARFAQRTDAMVLDVLAKLPASERRAVAQALARGRDRALARRGPGADAMPPVDAPPERPGPDRVGPGRMETGRMGPGRMDADDVGPDTPDATPPQR